MPDKLLVFLLSTRIDTYVNVITHAYEEMKINDITFIHIQGLKNSLTEDEAGVINSCIWQSIKNLSNGEYLDFSEIIKNKSTLPTAKSLNTSTKIDIYRRIHENLLSRNFRHIKYEGLKIELENIIKQSGGATKCAVDITTASKVLSIDIFSICLSLGIELVYTFELSDPPNQNQPEQSLYHELTKDKYNYTLITESKAVKNSKSAILRKSQLIWSLFTTALIIFIVVSYNATKGSNDPFIQLINTLASIVSLITPLITVIIQRRR